MAPKSNKGRKGEPVAPVKDPRFAHVHRDPRFMRPNKNNSKVTVDARFSSMLKGKEFSSAPKVDKYGRKLKSLGSDPQMKRFYQLQKGETGSDEDEDGDSESENEEEEDTDNEDEAGPESASASESESEDMDEDSYDPMRGRGVISGSDSDSDIDEDAAAELDAEAEAQEDEEEEEDDVPRGDESHRFACVNLDWDHIKSTDLFKVFSGFKPEKGAIRSVKIYPSEFGKERMEREEREGPPPEIFKSKSTSKDSDSDDEELDEKALIKKQTEDGEEDIDQEALRKYQLDRLKYYYAVVDCDSVETAKVICEACDGAEYESSANFFDLRYIPDGMEFDDKPRDEAFGAPENYKPNEFTTQVFQHSNVQLTWDEDDADRIKVTRHKFSKTDVEDMDFKAYLASSDEEDSEDDIEATKRKYRALLERGKKDSDDSDADSDDDKNQEMEITFAPGLSEKAAELLEAKKQREQPVKDETSIEAYKRKQKERKQRRKENRAARLKGDKSEDDEDEDQGGEALFSDDEDERLLNDPYFAEEFANGDMMPSGKGKKGAKSEKSKNAKKKRTKEERLEDSRKKAELELLMEDNRENNQHFNMKEIQKAEKRDKRKKKNKSQNAKDKGEDLQDDFKIDVSDPRFSALHESHHFALDPTNPHFKKTKAMTELLQERQKRTATMHEENEKKQKQNQKQQHSGNKKGNDKIKAQGAFEDPSLALLVDTVKRKSAMASEASRDGKRAKRK
ncbi:pre-rRNA-processing protein esf1 [Mortierella sp. NVP85]|nr:pre-rRNA-processing protein esf1 [Mortierella sp. NVP85]